jgi:quinol monooxygenase YgiN
MIIVHVFIEVKPEYLESFISATKANASASLQEPGIVRFDFLQAEDNPYRFVLNEVYRTEADTARHKETNHYQTWKKVVEEMMAVPRSKEIYANIFPEDQDWKAL